ncbi:MAG TPA: alpha-amylase family glycosyl hydrolase, partial [Kofleriaceae bacterium]|nr:alpha-amylase family glycosyl hydrolase [Kofleriaceae bacterium]
MQRALGSLVENGGTAFRVWSTAHERCALRLYDGHGRAGETLPMDAVGEGVFELFVPGAGDGARYRFVLGDREVNDPYARFLPEGIEGPSMVVADRYQFEHEHVVRPLREHAIYEMHVGTFTREGTYRAAMERLRDVHALGVTAIELLPVATFGGRHGWGYDGVAHYAPHPTYGTRDELKAFVDAAHGLGLAVFLDVVYNHFGPAGNIIGMYSPEYFTTEIENVWGQAPDFRQPWMRKYVLDNVTQWIRDFRFDGLRFDAVHAIVDPSEHHIVRACIETARAVLPGAIMIAEDDRNDPMLVENLGFDAVWADDFHHTVHVTATGERDGYYACYEPGAASIARAIEGGWLYQGEVFPQSGEQRGKPAPHLASESFIYCIQNHDQIGNRA